MLESLRKQGSSIFIYVIFGLLIAAFVINFGPQRGQSGGCRGQDNVVIEVDGNQVSQSAYHIAYSNPFNGGQGRQRAYVALEMLIRREILANEAEARGLSVSSDLMDEEIKRGNFYTGGQRVPLRGNIFDEVDGEQFFNIRKLKSWVGQLNVSMNAYKEEQQRALLAGMMAQLLTDTVQVSRDEALARFLYDGSTATYDVVAFEPAAYRAAMKLTDADVQRFVAGHDADIQKQFKQDERTYKGVKPQVQLREIYIAKAPAAAPVPPASGSGAGSAAGSGSATAEKADDPGKAKLDAARADIAAGKAKFADVAQKLATTEADQQTGGELGWRSVDSPQLGDKAVNDAIKTLKPGEMTPVIVGDHGTYLVTVENKREGDLTYDQVKLEIARELAKQIWSKEAARRAAIVALTDAQTGKKALAQMFDAAPAMQPEGGPGGPGGAHNIDIEKLLNDPRFTDEQRAKLRERLQQMPAPPSGSDAGSNDGAHGARDVKTVDVPVGWFSEPDGAGGGSASASGSGSAGSASGSASTGSGASDPAPAAPPQDPMKPSTDVLPAFGPVAKPKLEHEDPTPRGIKMPGLVGSKAASDALFDELAPGDLGKQIYEADGNYVVLQLTGKDVPKMDDFDKEAPAAIEAMRHARAAALIDGWLKDRCLALAKAGKINAAPDLVRETDDQGKALPTVYRPCMSFQ